jgi:hypothetical protein
VLHKKANKERDDATRASVKKEMAKPRMARSARVTKLNLDTARISEQPSTTMPGTVDKSFRLRVRASRKRHKFLLTQPTPGIDIISVLKIR